MIIKMRKYAFMVYHKEYDQFLSRLRDLEVVHIKEGKSIADHAELQQLLSERSQVSAMKRELQRINSKNKEVELSAAAHIVDKEQGFKLIEKLGGLLENKVDLKAERQSLLKDISYMELWGDFSYTTVQKLKKAGYDVTFYSCPTSRFEPKWTEKYNAILINNVQSITYFITITKEGTMIDIDAEFCQMPVYGLSKLQTRYKQLEDKSKLLDKKIEQEVASNYNTLDAFDKLLQDEFNLMNVVVQTDRQADEKLMLIEGWVADDKADILEKKLNEQNYIFQEIAIEANDKVPIQLKNNKYSRLFEPITEMYSLPHYGELDPTPFLAPFFMLFFGLCFGDGGYGLIILLLCTFFKRKVSPGMRPVLSLFQWLGGMTIVIGALTGSFFGIALVDIQAFQSIKEYFLSSDTLMILSIIIGIIHILYGKIIGAYKTKKQNGFKYSLASFAWVFVIASTVCVLGLPSLDIHLPSVVSYALYGIAGISFLVVLFYNTPGKNIFLNFGTGLWNTYNTVFGLLGDVLSYIRLFAVGLTGSILGGVFNTLAISMTESMPPAARFIVMLLILLVGHGLNFGLCMISSLVHPVRLVFVEYFKNSEFEGGGKKYLPFKKA